MNSEQSELTKEGIATVGLCCWYFSL